MHVTPVRFWRARGLCQCQVCAVGFCPHLARLAKHKRTLKTVAERRLAQDRACTLLHQRAHWCSSSTGAAAAAAAAPVCACRTTLFAFCGWPSAPDARARIVVGGHAPTAGRRPCANGPKTRSVHTPFSRTRNARSPRSVAATSNDGGGVLRHQPLPVTEGTRSRKKKKNSEPVSK